MSDRWKPFDTPSLEKALVWAGDFTFFFGEMKHRRQELVRQLDKNPTVANKARKYLLDHPARPAKTTFTPDDVVQIVMTCRSMQRSKGSRGRKIFSIARLRLALGDTPLKIWARNKPKPMILAELKHYFLGDQPGLYVIFRRLVCWSDEKLLALQDAPVECVGVKTFDQAQREKMEERGVIDVT